MNGELIRVSLYSGFSLYLVAVSSTEVVFRFYAYDEDQKIVDKAVILVWKRKKSNKS